jgi:hypothetical protein
VDETEISLLDHVEQGQSAVEVVLGDIHHQPQVVLDHLLPGQELSCARAPCPGSLLGR